MLLFEFFPAFIALVSLVVAVGLFVANRRAPRPAATLEHAPPARQSPPTHNAPTLRHTGSRPSMRG